MVVVKLSTGLIIFLVIIAALGLFNVYLSVNIYKMYAELYKRNKAAEKELAKWKSKAQLLSSIRDG